MLRPITLLILLALPIGGCSQAPEPAAGASAQPAADQPGEAQPSAAGQLQIQAGAGLSLPADFPKDVYLPDTYSIDNVTRVGPMTSAVLGLLNPPATLMGDIETRMKAQGWKTAMSMHTGGEGSVLAFSKPSRSVMYGLSGVNGQVQLSLQHTQQSPAPP